MCSVGTACTADFINNIFFFFIGFDFWTNRKKSVLRLVAYLLSNGRCHKIVLDTLPMIDDSSQNAESYTQAIQRV